MPSPSVFDLYRMSFKKALEYYKKGITSFEQLETDPKIKSLTQMKQIEFQLHDRGLYVDTAKSERELPVF